MDPPVSFYKLKCEKKIGSHITNHFYESVMQIFIFLFSDEKHLYLLFLFKTNCNLNIEKLTKKIFQIIFLVGFSGICHLFTYTETIQKSEINFLKMFP